MSKKEFILDIAEELFNQHGFHAVGVDKIRDETGVSKTSIYHHFGSKNQLIVAIIQRRHLRFQKMLHESIANVETIEDKLSNLLDCYFLWFRQINFNGCLFMHAFSEFKNFESSIANESKEHKIWLKKFLYDLFPEPKSENKITVEIIFAFLEGLIIRAEFENIDCYHNDFKEFLRQIVLRP